jgi:Fe-S-cluster-containing dehydrogenase component
VRVPCLGGFDANGLVGLRIAADEREIRLIDRGWCTTCPAGGATTHPAAAAVAELADALIAMGLGRLSPRLQRSETPGRRHDEVSLSRRGFLRRLAGGRTNRPPPVEGPASKRQAYVALLRQLAASQRRPLPASALPAAKVSADCGHHGLCAALCPTGALARYARDGAVGIAFDAESCISCRRCEAACPEHAISILRQDNPGSAAGRIALTQHALKTCAACEDDFVDSSDERLCPSCCKDNHLFNSGFAATADRSPASQGECRHDDA